MPILTFLVTDQDTALALGSGDVEVLGTPRLLAWMEAATVHAVAERLGAGQTSVGIEIALQHRRATPVGRRVVVSVSCTTFRDGRAECEVIAYEKAEDAANGQAEDAANEQPEDGPPAPAARPVGSDAPGPDAPEREAPGSGVHGPGTQPSAPSSGRVIATARITRAVVDHAAFVARLARD